MLPESTKSLLLQKIDVYLKSIDFRPPTFGQRILGRSFGGPVIQPAKVGALVGQEIDTVAAGIVGSIRQVIESVSISPNDSLENDLLLIFDSAFDECAAAIRNFGVNYAKSTSLDAVAATTWFDQRLGNAKQAQHVELKLVAAKILHPQGTPNTPQVLYNSEYKQVAIVEIDQPPTEQTGEGAET